MASSGGVTLSLNSTGGRFGGQSLRLSFNGSGGPVGYLRKSGIGTQTTMSEHFPLRVGALPASPLEIASFMDGSAIQASAVLNPTGTLSVYRGGSGGTLLATSSAAIVANAFYVFEFKVTFATGTGGTIELKAWGPGMPGSGDAIASTGSLNTSASGNASANGFNVGIVTPGSNVVFPVTTWDYEHFACLDDFVGDKRFYTRPPNSNPTAAWTPNASTNLSRVQEAQQDGAISIISSSNPGDQDWYGYAALPVGVQGIVAVIHSVWQYKSDAGARQTRINWKQGSTIAHGAIVNPSTTNAETLEIAYVDPVSGIAFIKSDVDTLLNGPELYS
jgi:hypothetical protein